MIRAVVKRAIEGGDIRPDLVFRARLDAIAKSARMELLSVVQAVSAWVEVGKNVQPASAT